MIIAIEIAVCVQEIPYQTNTNGDAVIATFGEAYVMAHYSLIRN